MKTLAELRTEIELGITVCPTTNRDIRVRRIGDSYSITASLSAPDGLPGILSQGYKTLDDLIADDIAGIASQPVWSTAQT